MTTNCAKTCGFTLQRLWALALLEHERTWFCAIKGRKRSDKCYRTAFSTGIGDEDIFKDFLIEYRLHRQKDYFEKRKALLQKVNASVQEWSPEQSLEEKACLLREKTESSANSTLSKFAWYVHPTEWAIYDSYASVALGEPRRKLGFLPFYKRLDELQFNLICESIKPLITVFSRDGTEGDLYPERIVDKMLWIVGSHDYFKQIATSRIDQRYQSFGNELTERPEIKAINEHLSKNWGLA